MTNWRNNDFEKLPEDLTLGDNDQADHEPIEIAFIGSSKIAWLQEIAFTMTKMVVVGVTSIVILTSVVAKAQWLDILVRAGVSLIVLGLVGWLFNLILGRQLVDVKYSELKEAIARRDEEYLQNVELEA